MADGTKTKAARCAAQARRQIERAKSTPCEKFYEMDIPLANALFDELREGADPVNVLIYAYNCGFQRGQNCERNRTRRASRR